MKNLLDDAVARQDHQKIIEICNENLKDIGEKHNSEDYLRYSIIKSISLIKINGIEESKGILVNLYNEAYKTIDVEFLLCHIFSLVGEYENSIKFGKIYLKHLENKKGSSFPSFTDADSNPHEICNNLGTMLLRLNRNEDAVMFFNKGLKYKDDYPLLYHNLGVVYSKLNRWDDAREIIVRGKDKCPDDPEIHRILGIVYRSLHYFGRSKEELMIAASLGSKEAFFDLAVHCRILCKFKEAKSWMDKYLIFNPKSTEAREFISAIKKSSYSRRKEPTISVCVIVKDEEEMLGQCLESIVDVADEIVVVDTGSKDKTVEIAEEFGANVFHHPWNDSFSEARNYSLRHATGDWILVIDADEVLEREDIPKVLESKWQKEFNAVCFAVYSTLPGQIGGVNMGKNYSARLFKNRKSVYYEGIVHNVLKLPKKTATSEIRMYHYGYDLRADKMSEKFERSIKLLLKQVEEDPEDAFVRYNTAQMFISRDFVKEAEEHAKKIVEIINPDNKKQQHLYLMGLYQLALINIRNGNYKTSERYCLEALQTMEDYVDPMHLLMWIYLIEKRYDKAKEMCSKLLEAIEKNLKKDSFNMLILNKIGSDYEAYYVLGEIAEYEGDILKAKDYIINSLKRNPYYWKAYHRLGEILMKEGDYKGAREFFEYGIKYGYLNAEKYGTIGAKREDYSSMLEDYKNALEKSVLSE